MALGGCQWMGALFNRFGMDQKTSLQPNYAPSGLTWAPNYRKFRVPEFWDTEFLRFRAHRRPFGAHFVRCHPFLNEFGPPRRPKIETNSGPANVQ